jgi:hypothetical protein
MESHIEKVCDPMFQKPNLDVNSSLYAMVKELHNTAAEKTKAILDSLDSDFMGLINGNSLSKAPEASRIRVQRLLEGADKRFSQLLNASRSAP